MDIKHVISQMTLEEKAGLCSGLDFWHTKPVERLGIPAMMVSDGPHGLRTQRDDADHLGINDSIEAVCLPAGSALACSFDVDLARSVGETLGDQANAVGLGVVLGPAINIKRSPLCGRNFEYLSEDPYLAAGLTVGYTKGMQSKHVGVSVKHFLANSQENRRMSSDSIVDERTLREIYLPAFEAAVKEADAWTFMCSYNQVNGEYACQNKRFLNDILRDEWGFEGFVMSDWGAVCDRVLCLEAGLELEMPASGGENDKLIVQAVQSGRMDMAVLDRAVERLLNIIMRWYDNRGEQPVWDKDADHAFARDVAGACAVLLKNDGVLPLKADTKVALIGAFADKPRFQGGGSSHINCHKTTSAREALADLPGVVYAEGYRTETEEDDEALLAEAVAAAKQAEVALVFAGLPDAFESEGYDREHMRMPKNQDRLIAAVTKAQPKTVVVLHNGSPVEMPWVNDVGAILEMYLGGQAVGLAAKDLLYGDVNPSGRLAETFPLRLEDNPSYIFYGGEKDCAEYREGIFVGYRYYDKKKMDVLFPFGFGLSYTKFGYSNLRLDKTQMLDTDTVTVSIDVTNEGSVAGKEVVQLYVADKESTPIRPIQELKGFVKVALVPGETKTVTFQLSKRAFAYYNVAIADWHVETGDFEILIGRSSRDIVANACITVTSTVELRETYTRNSLFGDIVQNLNAKAVIDPYYHAIASQMGGGEARTDAAASAISADMLNAMLRYMPLHALLSFGNGAFTNAQLDTLVEQLNAAAGV